MCSSTTGNRRANYGGPHSQGEGRSVLEAGRMRRSASAAFGHLECTLPTLAVLASATPSGKPIKAAHSTMKRARELTPVSGGVSLWPRRTREQSGGGVEQTSGAHRGHQRHNCALGAHPLQVLGIAKQPPGAGAAGMDEDVHGGGFVRGVLGAKDQALCAGDILAADGQARDGPIVLVLGVVLRPIRKDLPGSDGVEFFDPVEEQHPDVARREGPGAAVVGRGVGAACGALAWWVGAAVFSLDVPGLGRRTSVDSGAPRGRNDSCHMRSSGHGFASGMK